MDENEAYWVKEIVQEVAAYLRRASELLDGFMMSDDRVHHLTSDTRQQLEPPFDSIRRMLCELLSHLESIHRED
jgi:hypothetical protein